MDPHRLAEERSLAYHRVIADRVKDDERAIARAVWRITDWRARGSCSPFYLDAWQELLTGPRHELCAALVADDERARSLRQCTPFAGVLSSRERWEIWRRVRDDVAAAEAYAVDHHDAPGRTP